MSGNPNLNRMIRQTIYDLKHKYGAQLSVYKVLDSTTDYKTGVKSIETSCRTVQKGIVLPSNSSREIFQGVNYLSASKSFTSLGGQGWDESKRGFIIDGRDLRNYTFELEDWLVYRDKRYDIESIEELEFNSGWLIIAKEVKGQPSGGSISVNIQSNLGLTQTPASETETP